MRCFRSLLLCFADGDDDDDDDDDDCFRKSVSQQRFTVRKIENCLTNLDVLMYFKQKSLSNYRRCEYDC